MTTNPTALDLLKQADSYLSALHGSVARHDNLGLNLACGGCALRDETQQPETQAPSAAPLEQEVKRLGLMVDEYGRGASALTDKLRRARDRHRETCPLARGDVKPTAFKCGMCEVLDAPAVVSQPGEERPS
ncbi:hypothetical protein [Streptomyces sp. NPDC058614]|uniref:hypothetical protein n=1 Tax=Streptomyces sp. NPDC058614 TaxID=3346557 RepID=UPI003665F8C9